MVEETMRKNLYDAVTKGEVARFVELVEEDPYLLDVVSFPYSRNLLHIATMWGQAGIVEEVLKINPRLARNSDSEKTSPLHMAAAEGYVEIATKLVSVAPTMLWSRDSQGMNPIHVAAINGHAEFLEALVPHHLSPAREKVDRGQTVLHLCVKHGQLRALQVLVSNLGELVHVEDDDGEPILHLAIKYKQPEIVQYLMENTRVQENLSNSKGNTALQISKQVSPGESEITEILKRLDRRSRVILYDSLRMANDGAMFVSGLIATLAFQAAISPPGGVWQDDSPTHKAGTAIMASINRESYEQFVFCIMAAFTTSVLTIFHIIVSPPSLQNVVSLATVFFGTFFSILYFCWSFWKAAVALIPEGGGKYPSFVLRPAIVMYLGMLGLGPYCAYVVPRLLSAIYKLAAHPRVVVVSNYCRYIVTEMSSLFNTWRSSDATRLGVEIIQTSAFHLFFIFSLILIPLEG